MNAAISRAIDFVTGLGGWTTGSAMLVLALGYLMDFMQVRTTIVEEWSEASAVLPLVALVVVACGLILIGTDAWRWYAPRRESERFRGLMCSLDHLVGYTGPQYTLRQNQPAGMVPTTLTVERELEDLGVALPDRQEDLVELRFLAKHGRLKQARKQFPPARGGI